jgi:hypothetical protein
LTVSNMQGGSYDVWDINTDMDYHEEQKLEATSMRAAG